MKTRSIAGLTESLVGTLSVSPTLHGTAEPAHAREIAAAEASKADEPVAVFAVHGIGPAQRYAFQDQVAAGLQAYLNAVERTRQSLVTWSSAVYWPEVDPSAHEAELQPSALRIYRSDEGDPMHPQHRVYDVYEGYWAPFTKNKTNLASLLSWLSSCLFLASSSSTRVPSTWRKLLWDLGYLVALLLAAIVLVGAFLAFAQHTWWRFVSAFNLETACPRFYELSGSFSCLTKLPWPVYRELAVTLVAGYLFAQLVVLVRVRYQTRRRTEEFGRDDRGLNEPRPGTIPPGIFHVAGAIVVAVALLATIGVDVAWGGSVSAVAVNWTYQTAIVSCLTIVAAVVVLRVLQGIGGFIVERLLGDIQVYTTHDTTAQFYEIRQAVTDSVRKALLAPLAAVRRHPAPVGPGQPYPLYRRIHVLGHSLGSTIVLDVLMALRQHVNEQLLQPEAWERIRSLTTFGTALEKTRFFFDVRRPSVSAAQHQWRDDVYGVFFNDDDSVLANPTNAGGIYWSNLWYFRDVVANGIITYRSRVRTGSTFDRRQDARDICRNIELASRPPFFRFVHGDYLADDAFWRHVGPTITS